MRIRLVILPLVMLLACQSPAAETIRLQAGPLSMEFEPDNALLRNIRIGEHKLLQGINAPVRDQYWGTVPPVVTIRQLRGSDQSFNLKFDVTCRRGEIEFDWQGEISGTATGTVTFTFDGIARSTFKRNRIGFCILHGPEAAGKKCLVETVDGQKHQGRFPERIAPHQPFKNIRAITHEVAEGIRAKVQMEGDTFEMEDQRNWTDASFKTYCTPLELPFPVEVTAGTTISHKVTISVEGIENLSTTPAANSDVIDLQVATAAGANLPGIGLQVSSQAETLSDTELARLRSLQLDHLRVTIRPAAATAATTFRRATQQAERLGVKLHVGLQLAEPHELSHLAEVVREISPPDTWILTAANEMQVRAAREFLKQHGQTGRLGRGEDTNFTELNRSRPNTSDLDLISYGMNPQVHAFDNASMVETLAIQADTVRSARHFAGGLPLLITPITLRKQLINEPPPAGELPSNVDPRQPTLFTAAWTLGSMKSLAEARVASATYFETVGWLGVMERENGTPLPDRFPSRPGETFPVFHTLRALAPFADGRVRETTSSNPLSVVGLALERGTRQRLLLANLTPMNQTARITGFGTNAIIRRLDSSNLPSPSADVDPLGDHSTAEATAAGQLIVELPPYGIAIIDPPVGS